MLASTNPCKPTSSFGRFLGLVAPCALALLTFAIYARGLSGELLSWDDNVHVTANPHLRPLSPAGCLHLLKQPYEGLYIPLSYAFFAAEVWLAERWWPPREEGELSPVPFHFASLLLHALNAWLVYRLLRAISGASGPSLAGAALFAAHPLQVESVAWISETRGLLAATCGLSCLLGYFRAAGGVRSIASGPEDQRADTPGERLGARSLAYGIASVWLVAGLLCKPSAVIVPLVAVVLEIGWLRSSWRAFAWRLGPWLAVVMGWTLLTSRLQPAPRVDYPRPVADRAVVAGDALGFYAAKLVWPANLTMDYGRTPARVLVGGHVYQVLGWAMIGMLLASIWSRLAWLREMWWWAVALGPVLGLIPFYFQQTSTVADRYAYLALVGPAIVTTELLRTGGRARWAVAALLIGGLALTSGRQVRVWHANESLYRHALAINAESPVALNNLGLVLYEQGDYDGAIALYERAVRARPDLPDAHFNWGNVLLARQDAGDRSEALAQFAIGLGLAPARWAYYVVVGNLWLEAGQTEPAIRAFRQALAHDASHRPAHYGWGLALARSARYRDAVPHFQAALGEPTELAARINLAATFLAMNQVNEAAAEAERAVTLAPTSAEALYGWGAALQRLGDEDKAQEVFRRGLEHAAPDSDIGERIERALDREPVLEQ